MYIIILYIINIIYYNILYYIQGVSEFDTYFFITGTPIKTTPYVKISVRQFGLIKELEQF